MGASSQCVHDLVRVITEQQIKVNCNERWLLCLSDCTPGGPESVFDEDPP